MPRLLEGINLEWISKNDTEDKKKGGSRRGQHHLARKKIFVRAFFNFLLRSYQKFYSVFKKLNNKH